MTFKQATQVLQDAGFKPDTAYGIGYLRGSLWANIHGDGVTRKDCAVTIADYSNIKGCQAAPISHFEEARELAKAVA